MTKEERENYRLIVDFLKKENALELLGALNELTKAKGCYQCQDLIMALNKARQKVYQRNAQIKKLKIKNEQLKKQIEENQTTKQRREINTYQEPKKLTVLKKDDGPNDFAHALHNGAFMTWMID